MLRCHGTHAPLWVRREEILGNTVPIPNATKDSIEPIIISDAVYTGCGAMRHDRVQCRS